LHSPIKLVAYVIVIAGIIASIIVGDQFNSWAIGVSLFVSAFISGIVLLGFASIIESLHNIEMKIVGKPEESEALKRFWQV
jgi:hypothetical protein